MMDTLYPTDEVMHSEFSEHKILETYAYLVKRAIKHLRAQVSATFDEEDFYQIGMMGLMESVRRYGTIDEGFPNFAFKRIRGSILDELRRQDWRPRSLRQASHQLLKKEKQLSAQLGKQPSEQELAEYTSVSIEKIRELREVTSNEVMESFDDWLGDTLSGVHETDVIDMEMSMTKVLEAIPDRERLVVHLYYYEGLNMKEIALALDLTEPRVSQIHKNILKTMKTKIQR